MEKEDFWSQFSENFEELNKYVVGEITTTLVNTKVESISNLGKTLELGCANGGFTNILYPNASSVLATDYSQEMVEVARRRFKGIDKIIVEQANALNLQYPNNSFDTVFLGNLIHIVSDCDTIVSKVYNILKPGGQIIVLDYTLHGMSEMNKIKLMHRFLKTYGSPTVKAKKGTFSVEEMKELLGKYDFKIVEAELLGVDTKAVFVRAIK